ncbi:hypothetical protein TNCV_41411 [Trichonephila clavipes]|nr:hypothetical protein TNCV_41411 [Trichonephila clavipes]
MSCIDVSDKAGNVSKMKDTQGIRMTSRTSGNIEKVSAVVRKQKFRQYHPKRKVMREVFFDIQGIVNPELILEGRIVNKKYVDIMRCLLESIRKKRTKLWTEQLWVLMHDNAPAYQFLHDTDFLAKTKTVLYHNLLSPLISLSLQLQPIS